jgi:hypothetical protein
MRGKLMVSTVTHKMKKPKRVACDCERCKHSNKKHGFLYCTYFDLISPNRSQCIRYWGVKPKKKRGKGK